MSIVTAFTRAFNLTVPIVLAPIGGICGGSLAAAVAGTGGIGFIGTGGQNYGIKDIERILRKAEKQVSDTALIGVGLTLDGKLDKDAELLQKVVALRPRNLWLADPKNDSSELRPLIHMAAQLDPTMKLFVQVANVRQVGLASVAGAHVIVAQGKEGSGVDPPAGVAYGMPRYYPGMLDEDLVPLDELVSESVVALDSLATLEYHDRPQKYRPLLIAAGGVRSGFDVARLLALGADGVAIGTRFAVCAESDLPEEEKISSVLATSAEQLTHVNPNHTRQHFGSAAKGWNIGTKENICDVDRPAREIIEDIVAEARSCSLGTNNSSSGNTARK